MKLFVKVKPKAREDKVERTDETHYVVHTKSIPEKGKANKGVIQLLANHFKITQSQIQIVSGTTSHVKIITIHTQ